MGGEREEMREGTEGNMPADRHNGQQKVTAAIQKTERRNTTQQLSFLLSC